MRCAGTTDVDEARDAVQNAFIQAVPRWASIHHHRAWLRKVAMREYFRRPAPVPDDHFPDPAGPDIAAETLERLRQDRLVRATLQRLPYRQREALAWTYDGFKPAEIAALLGHDPAAVRQNLVKARRNLAKALGSRAEDAS
jgi:RNA polymerase sigma-70 factor (ECF subfamily)